MVEDDDVDVELKPAGGLERFVARRAEIDGYDEAYAARGEARDRLGVGPVALGDAVRDMDDRLTAAGGEILLKERGAAGAVHVVVAEDGDALSPLDRELEALRRRLHVAHDEGIGHELA